jgi:ribonuclease E
VESVSLAVLRALEDHLLRDARSSLTAVTTAEVALYILNNKRSFVTDMERRYGVAIALQASDRMQGANFAIERSAHQPAPQRTAERAVVNMESGFDSQEGEEEFAEEAEAPAEREDGGRRPRRRRRRGRRDDRPNDRPSHGDGERGEFARNGEAAEMGGEHADVADAPQHRQGLVEPLDEPAGTGEQPSIAYAEGDREGAAGDQRERPRRRRGRRGGRRGRDRYEAPRDHVEDLDSRAAEQSGNGSAAPEDPDPAPDPSPMAADPASFAEPRYEAAAAADPAPEPTPPARDVLQVQDEAPREPAPTPASVVLEPATPPPEKVPEEPSGPPRKGWWQRGFSGG